MFFDSDIQQATGHTPRATRNNRAPLIIESLLHRLGDPNPLVRQNAVSVLAHYRDPRFLIALRSALFDASANVRRAAIAAIARFDDPQVFADLVRSLDDGEWPVRRAAVRALGRFSAAVTFLQEALSDPSEHVVTEARHSLSRLQDEQGITSRSFEL